MAVSCSFQGKARTPLGGIGCRGRQESYMSYLGAAEPEFPGCVRDLFFA
jgi:hypothetical protein